MPSLRFYAPMQLIVHARKRCRRMGPIRLDGFHCLTHTGSARHKMAEIPRSPSTLGGGPSQSDSLLGAI